MIAATYYLDPAIVDQWQNDPQKQSWSIECGDVNGDGTINITDALIIATYDIDPGNPNLPSGIGQAACSAGASKNIEEPNRVEFRAEGAVVVSLDLSGKISEPGGKVDVDVTIDMNERMGKLGAYSAILWWDPDVVSYLGYTGGQTGGFDDPFVVRAGDALKFNQFDAEGAEGDVHVIRVSFIVKRESETSPFGLELNSLVAAEDFTDLLPYAHIAIHEGLLSPAHSLEAPELFFLSQNYPNPFNAETTISYVLPVAGAMNVSVYDLNGGRIRTLVDGHKEPGEYSVTWDGKGDESRGVASGVYLCRLTTERSVKIKKMVLIH